jgi:hypothetical protein
VSSKNLKVDKSIFDPEKFNRLLKGAKKHEIVQAHKMTSGQMVETKDKDKNAKVNEVLYLFYPRLY